MNANENLLESEQQKKPNKILKFFNIFLDKFEDVPLIFPDTFQLNTDDDFKEV